MLFDKEKYLFMLGKTLTDLLTAINIHQAKLPNNVNTSLEEYNFYDQKKHFLARYFTVSVWENMKPSKTTVYKKKDLIALLVNILNEYTS